MGADAPDRVSQCFRLHVPIRMFGALTDMSDCKRTDILIAENRDNLARAEKIARLGHIKFEQATGECSWSEGVYRMMGKPTDGFTPTSESILELLHPEDRPALQQHRREVMAGLEPPHKTLRAVRDDGHLLYVEFWSVPLRDEDGTVIGLFDTLQDVTERRHTEAALAQANQELIEKQYAIDQAVIVGITDVKGNITHVNDMFCRISGYSRDELLGANHRLLVSGTHSKMFFREMYRLIARGGIWRGEICNRAKNGSLYWVDTTIVPQFGFDGKPVAYSSFRVDITARKRAEADISYMASHDVLTGLGNRVVLNRKLDEAIERSLHCQETFAVFLLDLDGFKHINDTLGHVAGDALLKEMANRLRSSLRGDDFVARLGGDEFAVIQRGQENQREAAIALAVRLLEVAAAPFKLDNHDVMIGTSIGIAIGPDDGATPGDLLQKADLALYHIKANGRNNFCFFDSQMSKDSIARLRLLNELRAAMSRDEFELHYQPIFDAATCQPCGVEVLVRWRHPVEGLLPPDRFIPLAEEAGLIEPLGEWILERACKDAAAWPQHIKLAINLSAVQFRSGRLLDVILCALVESGLHPGRLEFEITETVLLQNAEGNRAVLQQLKNIGISIVLDDFGTGYSSLSYLTAFPFDKIKIDKSFTKGLINRADCAAIVASVLTLARGLDIRVTAEGIETKQQFELLRTAGVHQVQGYLFGRPCPRPELCFSAPQWKSHVSEAA